MTDTSPPVTEDRRIVIRYRWLVLVIVSLGMFVTELDTTVVNIALPSIQHALKFSGGSLQWVINAYLLCFGGFLLLAGRLSDRVGDKRMFLAGMLAFGAGSAMNAVAPSAAVLVIGRALQGLGGATLIPTTLSTVNATFTDPDERSRALGVWAAIQAGSVAMGLILGGVITSELSWRWIFTINIPIAVVAFLGGIRFVPDLRARAKDSGLDLAGAVTITAGLGLAVYALSVAPGWGWAAGSTVGLLAGAAALVLGFVLVERRSRRPMVPLGIFRVRPLAAGNIGFLFASAGMYGMFFFSSLYVQDVLGYSALRSGVALLPLTVGVLIGAGGSQPLIKLLNVRVVAVIGLVIGVAGALLLTRITVGGAYATGFLPGLLVIAVGLGLALVPFTMMATSGVPEGDSGLASGLYTATSYTGGAVGLAVLSTIAATRTARLLHGAAFRSAHARLAALVGGYHYAFVAAAVLLGTAAVLILGWLRREDVAATGRAARDDGRRARVRSDENRPVRPSTWTPESRGEQGLSMADPRPPAPYLHFPGTAREALTFYARVFGGSAQLHSLEDFNRTDGPAAAIAHGYLADGPVQLFAADAVGGQSALRCEGLMLSLLGAADPPTLRAWFAKLAEGGTVVDDFQARPWGASDGQVIDRYGLHWLIGFEDKD